MGRGPQAKYVRDPLTGEPVVGLYPGAAFL